MWGNSMLHDFWWKGRSTYMLDMKLSAAQGALRTHASHEAVLRLCGYGSEESPISFLI